MSGCSGAILAIVVIFTIFWVDGRLDSLEEFEEECLTWQCPEGYELYEGSATGGQGMCYNCDNPCFINDRGDAICCSSAEPICTKQHLVKERGGE